MFRKVKENIIVRRRVQDVLVVEVRGFVSIYSVSFVKPFLRGQFYIVVEESRVAVWALFVV
jgi:hypothetical protein